MAEPQPRRLSTHLDQILEETQRDIPISLPDATILIEAVKDLRFIIDAQAAANADFEARIFALENP